MGLCVVINPDGTLSPTGQPVGECSGYVLASAAEHARLDVMASLFTWPEPEVLGSWFMAAFVAILALNAAGYITGAVVKMVSTDRH